MTRALAALLLTACLAVGCAEDDDVVQRYCEYGAVSEPQLQGCVDHVTEEDVRSRQTHASQYAYGDLKECLEDAGPFCE